MNKGLIAVLVIIVLLGGWYIYKHSGTDTNANDAATSVAPGAVSPAPGMPAGAVDEEGSVTSTSTAATSTIDTFALSAGNYFFAPKTLTVNKGDTVKITVTNSGGFHDMKIDEFNVATSRLQSGQSATVTFVADKTGTFEYYCSVGDHRAMGMWGTLTVK